MMLKMRRELEEEFVWKVGIMIVESSWISRII